MPSAEVTRSDSNRSDGSQKPRVSFNRDVHIKRIVPRESKVSGGILGIDGGAIISSPIRKERLKKSKKEIAAEAAKVLRQADKVACVADDKGGTPTKFYTLPSRKGNRENVKEYPSHSLDRRSKKRQGSLEEIPPKKPPRTFASASNLSSSSKPSIFDIFKKPEKKTEPKKSNLRRSASDASALRSKVFGPVDSNTKGRKRSGSDSEENTKRTTTKKQLSPIIEATPREDYFATSDKENINTNIPEASRTTTKDKRSESVTDQLKEYIEEVDEALYKETGIRITTPPPKKEPIPIIIDLDKAENISSNKKNKLNFGLGKKIKSLTQKKAKTNDSQSLPKNVNVLVSSTPKYDSRSRDFKISQEKALSPVLVPSNIKTTFYELEKSTNRSPKMIHSSQKPADKPPLTKGNTVNTMVKRLSNDSCSSPPPTRTNVLIMPNMSVQHNNNQPFSYTRGISPDKYRSNEDLPRELPNSTKPVIYAQVVCGANGLSNGKQTVHTTYNGRRQPQSDSDEGLGGEDSLGFNRKYEPEKSFTRFGDDRLQSFLSDTDKLLEEIDKYKAESPILPKYRSPTHLNGFTNYNGIMERGRGDGMDAKRRESLTEPDMEFMLNGHSPGNNFSLNRTDLSTRRDMLESRINRRINDKQTPSPEHPTNKGSRNNVYISEKSSKYYRNGSTSPVGYKEKYMSETKTDQFGERHTESRTKKILGGPNDRLNSPGFKYNGFDSEPKSLDSQISDYRSSPENHRLESSQHSNIRSRYRTEKPKLFKDKDVYKSTPEIHHSSFPAAREPHNSYHDSLPRDDKFQSTTSSSQLTRSERLLNRDDCDRRAEKFDSGIENDFRRDSSERYKPARPAKIRRDLYNESEDEGFASSLLITSEKQHTENNLARKAQKDYDSDRNIARDDNFYRHNENKYIPRERSIDDGSHFDPRLDKDVDRSTLKRIEKKPPKPEKKSGLEKVKSLFMRDTKKKKEKVNTLQKGKSKTTYNRQEDKDDSDSKITRSSQDYRYRRRLSTPSPTRDLPKSTKSESTHGSWFKSLDRITRRKSDKHKKEENLTSTEEEPVTNRSKLSSSTSNLRFFGDTDQESNADSIRGLKPKKRPGLRSQSTRELHNISEELHKSTKAGGKTEAHHKSLTNISDSNREQLKGSRNNLNKPPVSPSHRYKPDVVHREDRRRRKRHDISSVESSTEGDSSQQSQRSIVYLHAATVGDIPGPGYLRNGRRSASREDLTSNGSSFIQPQVKTLSRSFSVLAPWKPRHPREGMDIDYTQYPKPTKNGKYEQKSSRNVSNRNDSSTLKKKAQDSKKNNYQQSLNRKSRSRENLTHQSKEEISRGKGSTSTLYKKKDKMPRENSRYNKDRDERKIPTKSLSVESISRNRDDRRDISRSVSMPRDTGKSAGWFRKTKKGTSNQRL